MQGDMQNVLFNVCWNTVFPPLCPFHPGTHGLGGTSWSQLTSCEFHLHTHHDAAGADGSHLCVC